MARLIDRLRPGPPAPPEQPTGLEQRFSLSDYAQWVNFSGHNYLLGQFAQTLQGDREEIPAGYAGYAATGYAGNGVVFAVSLARMLLFSEARFQFQKLENGRATDLFGTRDLSILERPDWNKTTGELLNRMDQDVTIAGSSFQTTKAGGPAGRRIVRLQPDWVTIVLGSQRDPGDPAWQSDAEVLGYAYARGGHAGERPEIFLREEVAHYSPYPDPLAMYRGMSWMTPLLREIEADSAARDHKLKFFQQGATSNMVVLPDASLTKAQFDDFTALFREKYEGRENAYRTILLGGGADVKVVGADLKQMDFKLTQGAGETRICAAAGVPPVIVGLSEGLQAATYSNYSQARRKFGDHWARPHWRMASAALETIVPPPAGSRLWVDDRDIPFLREDEQDRADIRQKDAATVRTLLDAGFKPDAAVAFVESGGDLRQLEGGHSGLYSVQLLAPGTTTSPDPAPEPDAKE